MEGEKLYAQPVPVLLNAINDIVELQNGRLTFSDTPHGKIHFQLRMYGFQWELRFLVEDAGGGTRVTAEIHGEQRGCEKLLRREFALLDAMLGREVRIRE